MSLVIRSTYRYAWSLPSIVLLFGLFVASVCQAVPPWEDNQIRSEAFFNIFGKWIRRNDIRALFFGEVHLQLDTMLPQDVAVGLARLGLVHSLSIEVARGVGDDLSNAADLIQEAKKFEIRIKESGKDISILTRKQHYLSMLMKFNEEGLLNPEHIHCFGARGHCETRNRLKNLFNKVPIGKVALVAIGGGHLFSPTTHMCTKAGGELTQADIPGRGNIRAFKLPSGIVPADAYGLMTEEAQRLLNINSAAFVGFHRNGRLPKSIRELGIDFIKGASSEEPDFTDRVFPCVAQFAQDLENDHSLPYPLSVPAFVQSPNNFISTSLTNHGVVSVPIRNIDPNKKHHEQVDHAIADVGWVEWGEAQDIMLYYYIVNSFLEI